MPRFEGASGATSFFYDANGNMVGDGDRTLAWGEADKPSIQ
ncbi:hypothetical protein [Hoeflea marina]|nr:hypothetical protein [Hoeflea marina]